MMEVLTAFPHLLQSRCVTIRAGEDGETLTVHEAVLSKSGSPSLQKLVEPGWRESSEGCIGWTHTSSSTVERVLTWLYLRDYQSPDPVSRGSRRQSSETSSPTQGSKAREHTQPVVGWDGGIEEALDVGVVEMVADDGPTDVVYEAAAEAVTAPEEPPAEPDDLEVELQNAILESSTVRPLTPLGRCVGLAPITSIYKTAGGIFEERAFPHQTFSYQEPLLAHVEVYSFAKYHLLHGLQDLALQRMIVTLRKMDCSVKYAEEELTESIEFVYDNVPAGGEDEEPMRKLLSQFAAANYTFLLHGSFEALFTRGGDFALDLARKLSRRLSAHGVSGELAEDELESRIQNLELQVQERDGTIKSLNASLDDSWVWGRGTNKKGRRR